MRITRLLLRNYRVFEDELELHLPAGLVGIYGPNGAGKSALIESIRWTLWGQARTGKDEVRTAGVNAECITEVEFEHEGHLYLVRRTISGVNSTVRAEAHWNGMQVAEGVRDVATYVHSVLGMDDQSFRASVFAEQKQVAAFSAQSPQKRRDLVLRLLGITPLDRARDGARSDARDARADHERLAARLPDLDAHLAAVADSADRMAAATTAAVAIAADLEASNAAVLEVEANFDRLDDLGRTYDALVAEGKGAAGLVTELSARLLQLTQERDDLAVTARRRDGLAATAADIQGLDSRVRQLVDVVEAQRRADAVTVPAIEPPVSDASGARILRSKADNALERASTLVGTVQGLEAELERAREAAARSATLSPHEDCPICGQALGDAFDAVQAHRAAEVADAEARLHDARQEGSAARVAADAALAESADAERALADATAARAAWDQVVARRLELDRELAGLVAVLEPSGPAARSGTTETVLYAAELTELRRRLESARAAADELARLEGRLERIDRVAAELAETEERRAEAAGRRETLLEKVRSLSYSPDDLAAARDARDRARAAHRVLSGRGEEARLALAAASSAAEVADARLGDARARHAEIHDLAERSRHLSRLADLLNDFRNNIVATVGPRLAAQAAELFAELTDHEYDRLEVDPESYELQIRDAGRVFGLDRFSGSETDLANLALRVAISEHVRFQSGGAVGLLVLDEVFGPLDEDRKARMLLALERLRSRFRQVLVVTHDPEIKEQLPSAIQVVKLPGRRATARVLSGI
jgi:DNA repair exonuclease SbcCD ATPase subunit